MHLASRLGNVLFGAGCLFAAVILALAIFAMQDSTDKLGITVLLFFAAIVAAAGWAARYVLTAR